MKTRYRIGCIFSIVLGVSFTCQVQKIHAETAVVECVQPPRLKLDSRFASYLAAIRLVGINIDDYGYQSIVFGLPPSEFSVPKLTELFAFEHFRRADNADLVFTVAIGKQEYPEVKIDKEKFKQIPSLNNAPAAAPLDFDVSVPVLLSLRDADGKLLAEQAFTERRTCTTSQQFLSKETVMQEWAKLKPAYRRDKGALVINQAVRHANSIAKSWIESINVKDRYGVQTFKKSAKAGLERFDAPSAAMLTALETYSQDKRKDVLLASLQPCVKFWEEELQKVLATDEKGLSVRFLCAYNLSQAYHWMEDFKQCDTYVEMGKQTELYPNSWLPLVRQIADKRPVASN